MAWSKVSLCGSTVLRKWQDTSFGFLLAAAGVTESYLKKLYGRQFLSNELKICVKGKERWENFKRVKLDSI